MIQDQTNLEDDTATKAQTRQTLLTQQNTILDSVNTIQTLSYSNDNFVSYTNSESNFVQDQYNQEIYSTDSTNYLQNYLDDLSKVDIQLYRKIVPCCKSIVEQRNLFMRQNRSKQIHIDFMKNRFNQFWFQNKQLKNKNNQLLQQKQRLQGYLQNPLSITNEERQSIDRYINMLENQNQKRVLEYKEEIVFLRNTIDRLQNHNCHILESLQNQIKRNSELLQNSQHFKPQGQFERHNTQHQQNSRRDQVQYVHQQNHIDVINMQNILIEEKNMKLSYYQNIIMQIRNKVANPIVLQRMKNQLMQIQQLQNKVLKDLRVAHSMLFGHFGHSYKQQFNDMRDKIKDSEDYQLFQNPLWMALKIFQNQLEQIELIIRSN